MTIPNDPVSREKALEALRGLKIKGQRAGHMADTWDHAIETAIDTVKSLAPPAQGWRREDLIVAIVKASCDRESSVQSKLTIHTVEAIADIALSRPLGAAWTEEQLHAARTEMFAQLERLGIGKSMYGTALIDIRAILDATREAEK